MIHHMHSESWFVSRRALVISILIVLVSGALAASIEGQRQTLYRAIIAAYIVSAVQWVIDLTPRLLQRLRPVVLIPDDDFDRRAQRVIGERLNPWLKLFAPLFAVLWLLRVVLQAINRANGQQGPFTELLMPIIEVVFSVVAVWRMVRLAQLSSQPLDINLFDARAVYPFGDLSFAYAAVISVRMVLQLLLIGEVQGGGMVAVFSLASVASFLALILPIWSVHVQMLQAKIKLLHRLDAELHQLTRPIFADTSRNVKLAEYAAQVQAIGSMRDRIAARWTWPVPDSVTAVQAIAISGAPTLLTVAKTYLGPLLGLS